MDAQVDRSTRVAVVGLGNMGFPMAERILEAGYPLAVFNRHAERADSLVERGATRLAAPRDALHEADVCVSVLADDQALESVVLGDDGVLADPRGRTSLIDLSTVSVDVSKRIAARAAESEVGYLRAPMSGNPSVLRGGNLTIMVSGEEELANRLDPLLRTIGPNVLYVGEDERARVVKLVLQTMIGGTVQLLAEAVLFGESAGVDRAKLLEVIKASVLGSRFIEYKSGPFLEDDYSATFTTSLMLKDIDLVLDVAAETGVSLPFTEQLRGLLESAVDGGHGDEDFMALYLQLRESGRPDPQAIRSR